VNAHVESLVQLFVKKDKRERLLTLASKSSRHDDFRDALLHDTRSLDPRVLTRLPDHGVTAESVGQALAAGGARKLAYCVSAVLDADDRELLIAQALLLVVGRAEDSLVWAIEARIAYYENHEGEQYVLRG
jgi:hypothetical protein